MKRKVFKQMLCLLLTLTMIVPMTELSNVKAENTQQEETTTETTDADTGLEIEGDYYNQYLKTLLNDNKVSAGDAYSVEANEKGKTVVFSGKMEDLQNDAVTIDKTFNFDGNTVGRFSVDGLSKKGTSTTLDFYLDDQTEPFTTVTLPKQKTKNDWTYSKNVSKDIYDLKLTGEHTVSFKVNKSTDSNPEFALKSFEFVESSVPVVSFDIDESDGTISEMNSSSDHSAECYGTMNIQVPDGYVSEYTGKELTGGSYDLEYIRGRGNSTWDADKKPYKIKLDKKSNLLGLGKNKHWVLLANYYDNSLLRNKITYYLAEKLGMEYVPQSEPVDVIMNGEYYGSYLLCEQVRVGENRVDIDDLEADEETMQSTDPDIISGGYLLSMFPYNENEEYTFTTDKDLQFLVESPSFEDYYNETQFNYIKDYVQKTEDAIFGTDYKNSDGQSYDELMDVESSIYYYLMQEFSMNGDAFLSGSTYLYKKRDGKLYWGPLWDFDYVAWGSTEYIDIRTTGFYQDNQKWFAKLLENKEYATQMVAAYQNYSTAIADLIKEGGQLDYYKDRFEITARYNFEKWGFTDFEGRWQDDDSDQPVLTYDQEIERLRSWISDRKDWMDKNIDSIVPEETTVQFYVDGKLYETRNGYVGRELGSLPEAPSMKGYVFTGWEYTSTLTYQDLLDAGLTDEDIAEWYTEKEIAQLKGDGIKSTEEFTPNTSIIKDMKVEGVFVKESEYVKPKAINTAQDTYVIACDWSDFSIGACVVPFDAGNTDLTYESADSSIATVDESGYIEGISAGTTTVTIRCGSLKKTVKVVVVNTNDESSFDWRSDFEIADNNNVTMKEGEYTQLPVTYTPEGDEYALEDMASFISVDPDIAEVNEENGTVYAKNYGSTVIIVNFEGNFKYYKITVKPVIKKGDKVTYKGIKYKVTSTSKKTLTVVGPTKKTITTAAIQKTVKVKGIKYTVKSVSSKAFYKCKKLKKVTFASKLSIGKKAFTGIYKKAVIKAPKKYVKYYKKKLKRKVKKL